MKYTEDQLKDPKWWDENAPEGAEALIVRSDVAPFWKKWDVDVEYRWDELNNCWLKSSLPWSREMYRELANCTIHERPTVDVRSYKCFKQVAEMIDIKEDGYTDVQSPKFILQPKFKSVAAETLRAALGHMEDRAATYDSEAGERSMAKTVKMFNTMYGLELTEEQGWAFMCLLKLVRTSQGDFRADNYEDLAAYAGLMCEGANHE